MSEPKESRLLESFLTLWIVIRVGFILVVWIGLFLAMFLGYFTVPIILVVVLTIIYGLSDAALLLVTRMKKQTGGEEA